MLPGVGLIFARRPATLFAMLLTGQEYLESIRDGRRVYVGSELVDDVTTHPAFRNAARSFAMIYDRKRAPENRAVMTVRGGWRNLLELFPAAAQP